MMVHSCNATGGREREIYHHGIRRVGRDASERGESLQRSPRASTRFRAATSEVNTSALHTRACTVLDSPATVPRWVRSKIHF